MSPLWFIKYDPVRTVVSGKDSMRFESRPFKKLKDAMAEISSLSMGEPYSFVEYAVVRWTESKSEIIVQGTIEHDEC